MIGAKATDPRSRLALGIDMGPSGARVVAMAISGEIVAEASARLADVSDNPCDPQAWWLAVSHALRQVLAAIDPGQVAALCIDATSGAVLPVTAEGLPLAEPLLHDDAVDHPGFMAAIGAHASRETAANGSTSGLAKALVLQSLPECSHILHQADWLAGQFTGRFDLTDENNALNTGYDPVARRWPEWIARTGLAMRLLPRVLPAGEAMGRIRPVVAQSFHLPPDVLVIAGTTEECATFLAAGVSHPGDGVTVLGQTLTMTIASTKPIFAPEFGIYSQRLGDIWLAGGTSNSGGAVLEVHFPTPELETLSALIEDTPATGLDFYPLARPGERFPIADPALPPKLSPRPQSDAVFLRALLEGMVEIEVLGYQRLAELGAPALETIRAVGGGIANPAWMRLRAERFGPGEDQPVHRVAAAGVARLAFRGLGLDTCER